MRTNIPFFLLLSMIAVTTHSQTDQLSSINIGDPAPPLQVSKWLKGEPIKAFEKGSVYVVEFWATWCKPCRAAMPHLSALARQYGNKLKVVGIDVYEKNTPEGKIKSFVDSMGERMDYYVAADKDKIMETFLVRVAKDEGIPLTIIINAEGKIAWIGHPKDIEKVVPEILNNTWDIKQELIERNLNKHLEAFADSMNFELMKFRGNYELMSGRASLMEPEDPGQPDSALFYIDKIIQQEPRLQYEPSIAFNTFYSLLKIDPQKASVYGKKALTTSGYQVIGAIGICSSILRLPAEIYELGAEAYQADIDQFPYPELLNASKYYHKMAWWYWLAKNRTKAIEAEQNAVVTLKNGDFFLSSELAVYKAQLELYKTCSFEE